MPSEKPAKERGRGRVHNFSKNMTASIKSNLEGREERGGGKKKINK